MSFVKLQWLVKTFVDFVWLLRNRISMARGYFKLKLQQLLSVMYLGEDAVCRSYLTRLRSRQVLDLIILILDQVLRSIA